MKKQTTARERITAATTILIIGSPFYATCILNLDLIETDRVPTMATDGRRLLFNAAFVATLTDEELCFVLAHEASHCVLCHMTRRRLRDPEQWNIAADYVINAELVAGRIGKMPKGGLLDSAYARLSAEEVYSLLEQKAAGQSKPDDQISPSDKEQTKPKPDSQAQKQGGSSCEPGSGSPTPEKGGGTPTTETGEGEPGEPGTGSTPGTGGEEEPDSSLAASDPGGCGGVMDAVDDGDIAGEAELNQTWERITRQAVSAATKHAGKVPGFASEALEDVKRRAEDWRALLRDFIDPSSRVDYSFAQPDRRFGLSPFVLPGPVPDGINHLIIGRDTSGSISGKMLALFNVELQSFLDCGLVDKITLLDCDTRVTRVLEVFAGETLPSDAKGRGGTSFRPVWQWLAENASDAAAVVYFTDLDPGDGFGEEPALPLLWAAYGTRERAPFGRTIHITD